jgi:hypothetical protein
MPSYITMRGNKAVDSKIADYLPGYERGEDGNCYSQEDDPRHLHVKIEETQTFLKKNYCTR